jgi:hypothetical protein
LCSRPLSEGRGTHLEDDVVGETVAALLALEAVELFEHQIFVGESDLHPRGLYNKVDIVFEVFIER